MVSRRLDCDVVVREEHAAGKYANAFRVMDEAGSDCFLDFMVYSQNDQKAEVVSRVRIRREFVAVICERLNQSVQTPPSGVIMSLAPGGVH